MDMASGSEDAARIRTKGAHMRYKTHAVDATTGAVACGITADWLEVLDQNWEEAFLIEKCPGCFAAVVAHGQT